MVSTEHVWLAIPVTGRFCVFLFVLSLLEQPGEYQNDTWSPNAAPVVLVTP
jgi:hypothetical protein